LNKSTKANEPTADVVNRVEGNSDNSVAFIFSCPGRFEFEKQTLVSGPTGTNLVQLLMLLNKERPDAFKYTEKSDYRITNASNIVHCKEKENGSEPSCSEIKDTKNINRLFDDIRGYNIIIAFGKKACYATRQVSHKFEFAECKMILVHHLGNQGLAHIKKDIYNNDIRPANKGGKKTKNDNTTKRLQVISRCIIEQLSHVAPGTHPIASPVESPTKG